MAALSHQMRMRRALVGALSAIVLVTGLIGAPANKQAAAATCTDVVGPSIAPPPASSLARGLPGYHAQFYGHSGYPTLCAGSLSTATVAFSNSGSLGWYLSSAPAYLGTWSPEPGQDRPSVLGGDGTQGSPAIGWPSYNRIAVQPTAYVGPGDVAWFQFKVQAPTAPGVYKLAIRPVVEGKQWLEDFGVFWVVTVKADDSTPAPTPAPTATRDYFPVLASGARSIRVPSLMYHYVDWLPPEPDRFRVDLTVSPTDFEEHLKYLKAQGYTTVTTNEIWWTLDQGGPLPSKPVHLTFDDGTVGQYSNAFRLLKQYGMVGTFFISANLVGRGDYVTREMVREMADGGMDIQSHAVDHFSLTTMPLERQQYQACMSRRILSEWIGREVRHFAYPAGDYNSASFTALATCGYLSAYWDGGGSLQSSSRMLLLYRERIRGQQGLASLIAALSR